MIQTLTIALLITNIVVILMYWFKPKTEHHTHIINLMGSEEDKNTLTKIYEGNKTPYEVITRKTEKHD
jgi:hypothetical protein